MFLTEIGILVGIGLAIFMAASFVVKAFVRTGE